MKISESVASPVWMVGTVQGFALAKVLGIVIVPCIAAYPVSVR